MANTREEAKLEQFRLAILKKAQAQRDQILAESQAAKGQALQAEEERLNTELEFKLSNKNVEEIASRNLGLAKLEKYQVDYIDMSSEDVVTLKQDKEENVWNQIGNVIAKIQSYLVA